MYMTAKLDFHPLLLARLLFAASVFVFSHVTGLMLGLRLYY